MGELIAKFDDGSYLEFARGSFDAFCVFEVTAEGKRIPPKDVDYFRSLINCAELTSRDKVYGDFVEVYEMTGQKLDSKVVDRINTQSNGYSSLALVYAKAMSMVYAGMIAENNKAYTKLGKRIKRLGLFVLLNESGSIDFAANFMRGKGWRDIDALCTQRGF
jgi:hypothetical protein